MTEDAAIIQSALPAGRTFAEAVTRARAFFRCQRESARFDPSADEDEWIDDLVRHCTRLCAGDEDAGRALAQPLRIREVPR